MSRPAGDDDPHLLNTGPTPDIWSVPYWKVDAAGPGRRTSWPAVHSKRAAFKQMGELQSLHPEYTDWAVLKFEKFIHVTKEEPDESS